MRLLLLVLLFPIVCLAQDEPLLDPMGAGKNATGGRGQVVKYITTMNPTGAGSLQECINTQNVICVFRTCGLGTVTQSIEWIGKNNITIYGQSANGGVAYEGSNIPITSPDKGHLVDLYNSDNLIMYNVGFDYGENNTYDPTVNSQCCDPMHIEGNETFTPENIFFSGLTVKGAYDENFDVNSPTGVTIANSIISFPKNGKDIHFGACEIVYSATPDVATFSYSSLYNYKVGCARRNPECKTEGCEFIGNVVLQSGASYPAATYRGGGNFNAINEHIYGINSGQYAIQHIKNNGAQGTGAGGSGEPTFFFSGNVVNGGQPVDPYDILQRYDLVGGVVSAYIERKKYRNVTTDRLGFTSSDNIIPTQNVEDYVLKWSGARWRIDGVGQRVPVTNNVNERAVYFKTHLNELVSYGTDILNPEFQFESCTNLYPDTDVDGMSDDWEDAFGLDRNTADHNGTTVSGTAKTNIECFMLGNCKIPINDLYNNSDNRDGSFTSDNSNIYLPSQFGDLIDEQYGIVKTKSSEGYTVITDKERVFIAVKPEATGFNNILTCPHRYHDTYSGDICLELFKESDKVDAVIISTTHRYDCSNPNNGTTEECDMARNPDSLFHRVSRAYMQDGFNNYQLHGFGASQNFTGIGAKNGVNLDIIIASTLPLDTYNNDISLQQSLQNLETSFETNYSEKTVGHCYATANNLCANVNTINNDNSMSLTDKKRVKHIELKRNVRDDLCSVALNSNCPVTETVGRTNRVKLATSLGLN